MYYSKIYRFDKNLENNVIYIAITNKDNIMYSL